MYDYDRYLDSMMEAQFAETDAYVEWCEATGRDVDADNTDAWEDFKQSQYESEMELDRLLEEQERMEMGDEWYE